MGTMLFYSLAFVGFFGVAAVLEWFINLFNWWW